MTRQSSVLLAVVAAVALLATAAVAQTCSLAHPNGGNVVLSSVPAATLRGTWNVNGLILQRTWAVSLCAAVTATPPSDATACAAPGFVQQFSAQSCESNYASYRDGFVFDATLNAFRASFQDAENIEIRVVAACGTTAAMQLDGAVTQQQVAVNAFTNKTVFVMRVTTSAACSTGTPAGTAATGATTTGPATTAAAVVTPAPTPVPTTPAPPTPVPTPVGPPVNVLVIANFQWTTMAPADSAALLQRYVDRELNIGGRRAIVVRMIDSGNSVLAASVNLMNAMSNFAYVPDVVVVADSTDVTVTIQNALRATPQTQSVPVISAFAGSSDVLDGVARPLTMAVVPSDRLYVRGIFELAKTGLKWGSTGIIYSQNTYGRALLSAVDTHLANGGIGPVVLTRTPMSPAANDAADDDMIAKLLLYKPVGVLCLVSDGMIARIRAAVARNPAASRLFLITTPTALSALTTMTGSPSWGAAIVPSYTRLSTWVFKGYLTDPSRMDEPAAFLFSHAFDALRVVSNGIQGANVYGADLLNAFRGVNFQGGFTGTVSFTAAGERNSATIVAVVASSVDQPLAAWSVTSLLGAAQPPIVDTLRLAAAVVASPLRAITVCLASTPSCPAVATMNHALFMLLSYNGNTSLLGDTTLVPVAINTGFDGVTGLRNLIPIASQCKFLLGPGSTIVNFALSPVVNQYRIPQIDFSAGSTAFSDVRRFPFFSRVVPNDILRAMAMASVVVDFAWERVLLVTTDDEFGTSQVESITKVMETSRSLVEATYKLTDLQPATIAAALKNINDIAIGRIIIVSLSGTSDDSRNFYQVVQDLGMHKTHIFILGDALCQHALDFPEMRAALIGSICTAPKADAIAFDALRGDYTSGRMNAQMRDVLAAGGFDTTCPLTFDDPYSAFAFDAATLLVNAIYDTARNVSGATRFDPSRIAELLDAANTSVVVDRIRQARFLGVTGPVSLDALGDRQFAWFSFNIQQYNNRIVDFAEWNSIRVPPLTRTKLTVPLRWLDNTTAVPSASIRSISFIAMQTAKQHPATIVLSVLGFVATIGVFVFCYRHYRLQKLLEEQALDAGAVEAPADVPPKYAGGSRKDATDVELRKK